MEGRYRVGERVVVRSDTPKGYCRTPFYLRGRPGIVTGQLGPFLDPEKMGYGLPGLPKRFLYTVRFGQSGLWSDYDGPAGDTLIADIFEHWLDPAE